MKEDLVESFSGARGIWGKGLNKELALKYGLSFTELLRKKLKTKPCLIIGSDTRGSSKEISKIFRRAFSFSAKKIINVGVLPIPAVELGVRAYGLDGGVMITASHSPKEFNGWKLLDNTGAIISPSFFDKVSKLAKEKEKIGTFLNFKEKFRNVPIFVKNRDLKEKYIDFAKKIIGKKGLQSIRKKDFKIVVDPNGGASAVLIKKFLQELGVKGCYLNMELGKFKRKIEPDSESLDYLRKVIREEKADFGVGFDCDGDRAELVLGEDCDFTKKRGRVVNGQYVLALSVDEILSGLKSPKNRVVVTNDCTSNLVKRIAEKYKAKTKEVEIGEINVVNKMLSEKSPVGGEGSNGGVIFPPSRCRDGLLAVAVILRHLANKGKGLAEVLSEYPDFFTARDKLSCPPEEQMQVRENIKNILQKNSIKIQERGGKTGTVKALIDRNSFIFFRASKTEPGVFRVISDAPDKKTAEQLLKQGIKIFNLARANTQGTRFLGFNKK